MAYLLEGFAALAAQRQPERALQLAAAATALRRASGSMLPPADRAALELQLKPARQTLGADGVETAWQAGAALSPDQAVAMALMSAGPPPRMEAPETAS